VVHGPKHPLHRHNRLIFGKFQDNAFLFPVYAMFRHDCPLAVNPVSTPRRLVHKKNFERFSTYMLLSAVSVLIPWHVILGRGELPQSGQQWSQNGHRSCTQQSSTVEVVVRAVKRFYCVTTYLTEKLSKLRSCNRQ
jgi:hypothetical protein